MQRILIYMNIEESEEYDIFHATDIEKLKVTINRKSNKQCPNFGNRLWFQALISEITSEDNCIEYYKYTMTNDYINQNYDLIIAPMANIFSLQFGSMLEPLAEKFEGLKIPVYVIACGVQADSYDDLEKIYCILKRPASRFIRSIYNTGGEFALRGYFTKEFFERLGFNSAVVTGCPSLYQLGESLRIKKRVLKENEIKPIINGVISDYYDILKRYSESQFFAQHEFFEELYDKDYFKNNENQIIKNLIKIYGIDIIKLLSENRIKLIPEMNVWREYIIQEEFNFSFGKRIHGTIMSLLAGIPSVLEVCDSRTREMVEFFDIPYIMQGEKIKYDSLYDLYEWVDYGKFNKNFSGKYEQYQRFLSDHGIVKKINSNNPFFYEQRGIEIHAFNTEELLMLYRRMKSIYPCWCLYEKLIQMKRKMKDIGII